MMQFFVFFCFSIFFIKTATKQKNILNKQKYNLLQCFNNCDKLRQTATNCDGNCDGCDSNCDRKKRFKILKIRYFKISVAVVANVAVF